MIGRTLDRYVLRTWLRIFVLTALGFPLVSIMINLTDKLSRLLDQGLTAQEIALSYVYSIPENLLIVMPAAVLFATVFTVGSLGRYSELTAAKAGGVSFHRLMLPVFLAAGGATLLALGVGEVAPVTSQRSRDIQEAKAKPSSERYSFVFRADRGWVYTVRSLDASRRVMTGTVFERKGTDIKYPTYVVTADSGVWDPRTQQWKLKRGAVHVIADTAKASVFQFASMRLKTLSQSPIELLAEAKAPEAMRYQELGRYIDAMRRSGSDANKLMVEQALKIAVPVTCLIIAFFGAPMAVTSPRAGSAVGFAIGLGTTVVFLLLIQITKAVGAGGLVNPVAAAWIPNAVFLVAGLVLLAKVRT
ncbi:MAG: LptF/LptG family permease [Gemmatimonadota bacterium]